MAYTADQIAGLFAARLPATGGWISAKQVDWLLSQFARENRIPRPRTASGILADGREWVVTKSGNANGAGSLQIVSPEARKADADEAAYQARCREVNEQASALFLAGKLAEAEALIRSFMQTEAQPAPAPAAPRTTADHGIEEWEVAPATTLTPEERARINEMARRYGPSGKFNRARAERDVIAARQDLEAIEELGPDALAAELSTLCEWYSDSFDGTPDEIFHRSEADGRRYERIKGLIERIDAELTSRQAAELAHANRANGD